MLLQKGSFGSNVTYLQYGLHIMCFTHNGFDGILGNDIYNAVIKFQSEYGLSVDGIAGTNTYNEVLSFQRANNLVVDGQVGPATRSKLFSGNSSGGSLTTKPKIYSRSEWYAEAPTGLSPRTDTLKYIMIYHSSSNQNCQTDGAI